MHFVRQSFKRQMFIAFLAVTLFLVIPGGIITVRGFQARVKADYERQDAYQEAQVKEMLLSLLGSVDDALLGISENEVLRDVFSGGRKNSLNIYSALYEETKGIREFAVVDIYSGGQCIYSTRSGYKSSSLPEYYSVLWSAAENEGRTVFSPDPGESGDKAPLLAARQIKGDEGVGYAVVRIEQDRLKSQLEPLINAKDAFMITGKYFRPFFVLGSTNMSGYLDGIRENLFSGRPYNGDLKGNIYISELGDTGLLSIYITPPAIDETSVRAGYQIIIPLAILSAIVCLIVANAMSNYVFRPLKRLAEGMRRFRKGDFDAKIELGREDEFEQLAVGFNKMTSQLKATMEEQVQAERTLNETRIEMMQAQLNPHFLYNTLDTIKWAAKAGGVPEVATMSASLAGILRTSISEKQFCKLKKELELVQNYCEIQKIRFDDRFDLTVDVPDEVREAVIPKLILQPIVENAIIHGMNESESGHIYIAAVREMSDGKDLLKISIQDDGKGISDEMMNALNNDDVATLKGHLGLNNVNTIIRIYYGREYGVMAFRPTTGGTVMIVTLPYSEESGAESEALRKPGK